VRRFLSGCMVKWGNSTEEFYASGFWSKRTPAKPATQGEKRVIGILPLLLISLAALPQGSVRQKTQGWCSPSIANVEGNITVNCVGVDPRAVQRLNELLSQKDQQLREKIQQANEWAEKYFELEKRLSEATDDARLSEAAAAYLHEGELDKAEAILNDLLQREEQLVDRAAANNFNLALILDLQFQPAEALLHLEKAYHYRPDNVEYAHQYARALESANRLDDAEEVYRKNLRPHPRACYRK
jgi:tetratricopeptide (TPR) repeat protein